MFKSAKDISRSKEFRRLDDGRYLFRDQPWSRTVILDPDTAVRVFHAREKFIRRGVWLVAIGGGLGGALVPLYEFGSGLLVLSLLVCVVLPMVIRAHFARERAYHRIVRNAPTAPEKLPFQWPQWPLYAERFPPSLVKFVLVFCPVYTLFMALGVWAALSLREIHWEMLSIFASLSLLSVSIFAVFWKIWRVQKDNRASRGSAER